VTTVSVPSRPASAAIVRQRFANELAAANMPNELVEDAVLIATELMSNAIRHAHALPEGHVTVAWEINDASVTVRVTDGGASSQPRVRHPGPNDISGRGLSLVQAIAAQWGVEDDAATTTVWARLRV
jgi:anti-sigma regulatory factor (Ser/Thr protein kinase)